MAGMLNSDNQDKKAAIADLSNLASMYAQNDVDSGGIMGAPKGDDIDAGSWWSWLNGTTRQKTDEYKVQAQEDLQGMDFSGAPAGYQSSMEEDLAKLLRMRGEANPLVQTSVEQPMVSDDLAAREDLPAEELNDDEYFLRTGELREPLSPAPVEDDIPSTGLMSPDQSAIEQAVQEAVSQGEPVTEGEKTKKLDGKDGDLEASYDEMEMDAYLDAFIPEMAELEGMGGDVVLGDLEPTYSYGITERKANEYGMQPGDYDNMEAFARAFAARYREEKEGMYPDIFTADLNKDIERGLQSYLWNRGSFYTGQLRALNSGDFVGFIDELKDVVFASDRGVNGRPSRPMSGLSKRRAAEANLVGRGIEGYIPIATVETAGTRQRPTFIWKDAQGNTQNSFSSTKPLHSSSAMGEIAVPL